MLTTPSNNNESIKHKVEISCEPVQQFLIRFKVENPTKWLDENCSLVKKHYPSASCAQLQYLLSGCFHQLPQKNLVFKIKKF